MRAPAMLTLGIRPGRPGRKVFWENREQHLPARLTFCNSGRHLL